MDMNPIGTLSENSLHAAIKQYLKKPGDQLEHPVGSYIVDIFRENTCYEIQTKNFYSLRSKLDNLLNTYSVHIVHPIAQRKWILRIRNEPQAFKKRKSPKKCTPYHVFDQLIYIPHYLSHPNLTIEILMIEQENVLIDDGKGSWRRKGWSIADQKLLKVIDHIELRNLSSYTELFPADLSYPFRTSDLASSLRIPQQLAQKMAYTLHRAGLLKREGKAGNAYLYSLDKSALL